MKKFILTLVVAVSVMAAQGKPGPTEYTLARGYDVTIDGTSNLHAWNEKVTSVTGAGRVSWNADGSYNIESVNITMEVRSIKSDMGSAMNNNTYKALKADDNPSITFVLSAPLKSASGIANVHATGNLTIAGVTRQVDMQVKVLVQNGILTFEGVQKVNMTDYGIAPPTALFGTLKTGNQITITFKTSFTGSINS